MSTAVIDRPTVKGDSSLSLDSLYQVVLFNDDVNKFGFVVECLMKIFGHRKQLAEKIAMDAHKNGKTIAEVEDKSLAIQHKEQLVSYGLLAEVEPI